MAMLNPYQKFGQMAGFRNVASQLEKNTGKSEDIEEQEIITENTPKKNNPAETYLQNKVLTATPEELTLMLFDGALRFITQAKMAIDEKDYAKANESIVKAENIILEFISTLNMDYELSKNLASLYDFMYNHLIQANIKKDNNMLDEVYALCKDLRDTWAEAMKLAKRAARIQESI